MNEEEIIANVMDTFEELDEEVDKLIIIGIKRALQFRVDNHNWIDEKDCFNTGFKRGFQKGKLEQKKEEFGDFIKWLDWLINSPKNTWSKQIKTKLEQLQKEIKVSGDSLTEFWDNPEDNRWDKEEEKQDE